MKYFKFSALIAVMILISSAFAFASDITIEVIEGKKASYKKDDQLTAKIVVELIHRNCDLDIKSTKLNTKGLKINKATKWVEKEEGVFERKVKLQITASKGKATLEAVRECSRRGGEATLTLPIK